MFTNNVSVNIKNNIYNTYYCNSQNGLVSLVLVCCGMDSNPSCSVFLHSNGAGIHPTLGNLSRSSNEKIDGNSTLPGNSNGMLSPFVDACIF